MFAGAQKLVAKIKEYNPKIAVFNGKGIYEVFSGQKEFIFGKQPDKITDTETVGSSKTATSPPLPEKTKLRGSLPRFIMISKAVTMSIYAPTLF